MALTPGTRIGHYEIVAPIGAGGMGDVYRARDPKLGREVAIKMLPDAFALDAERLARFEREARTLASLNHPNVAQVYGFENGAIVMELLQGDTLRAMIDASKKVGGLPLRKAVDIASQLARGLAAAHERGIIHRDLKPENVFVLADGHLKILDFGLAAPAAAGGSGDVQTVAAITDPGTVMGTVGYMAPEQVRGQPLDARADLFALGAVLYEMLTGERAFLRDTSAETLTAILKEDPPDVSARRADSTPALDRIVRHCLEKNPMERFQTARDVAFAVDALSGSSSSATAAAEPAAPSRDSRMWMFATAIATAAAVALAIVAFRPAPGAAPAATYVASLPVPEGANVDVPAGVRLALSPDGRQLAFVVATDAGGLRSSIFVQSLSEPVARLVEGSEDGVAPFWSPDSRTLGFLSGGVVTGFVKRVENLRGAPVTIPGAVGLAGYMDDKTLFLLRDWGIRELVPPATELRDILIPSETRERYAFFTPLPGGRRMLYFYANPAKPDTEGIYTANRDGSDRRLILARPEAINAFYANGALLFVRNQAVVAQPFDLDTEVLSGEPTVIGPGVVAGGGSTQTAAFSVSETGTLVYQPARAQQFSRLQWISRSGQPMGTLGDDSDYSNLELSPDGSQLAVSVTDSARRARDIWTVDVARGVRQRVTFDPSEERSAAWTPDGARLIYNSRRLDLYVRAANGTGREDAIQADGASKDPRAVSPDGKRLMYRRSGTGTSNDLWILPLDGSGGGKPVPVLETPFSENYGSFSPDGRLMVYASNESGAFEVYVLALEVGGGSGGKVRISTAGGTFPRWRRDGKEIFYIDPTGQMMSVAVIGAGPTFTAAAPRLLFRASFQPGGGVPYDVTPDGQKFIVNTALPSKGAPAFTIVVNWPALMEK
jgi:Tol biopolymer transport system component